MGEKKTAPASLGHVRGAAGTKQGCNPLCLPAAGPSWRQPGTRSRLGSGLHHPSKGPVLLRAAMPAKSVPSHRNVETWGNQPSKGSLQCVGDGGCEPRVQRCARGNRRGRWVILWDAQGVETQCAVPPGEKQPLPACPGGLKAPCQAQEAALISEQRCVAAGSSRNKETAVPLQLCSASKVCFLRHGGLQAQGTGTDSSRARPSAGWGQAGMTP